MIVVIVTATILGIAAPVTYLYKQNEANMGHSDPSEIVTRQMTSGEYIASRGL